MRPAIWTSCRSNLDWIAGPKSGGYGRRTPDAAGDLDKLPE
jgi:hypothetical protein